MISLLQRNIPYQCGSNFPKLKLIVNIYSVWYSEMKQLLFNPFCCHFYHFVGNFFLVLVTKKFATRQRIQVWIIQWVMNKTYICLQDGNAYLWPIKFRILEINDSAEFPSIKMYKTFAVVFPVQMYFCWIISSSTHR